MSDSESSLRDQSTRSTMTPRSPTGQSGSLRRDLYTSLSAPAPLVFEPTIAQEVTEQQEEPLVELSLLESDTEVVVADSNECTATDETQTKKPLSAASASGVAAVDAFVDFVNDQENEVLRCVKGLLHVVNNGFKSKMIKDRAKQNVEDKCSLLAEQCRKSFIAIAMRMGSHLECGAPRSLDEDKLATLVAAKLQPALGDVQSADEKRNGEKPTDSVTESRRLDSLEVGLNALVRKQLGCDLAKLMSQEKLAETPTAQPSGSQCVVAAIMKDVTSGSTSAAESKAKSKRKKKKKKKKTEDGSNNPIVPSGSVADLNVSKGNCKAVIWGDSMIRQVRVPGVQVKKKCHPGASVASMTNLLESCQDGLNPDSVVIHVGTNSLRLSTSSGQSGSNSFRTELQTMMNAARSLYPTQRIILSGILFRRGFSDEGINRVNEAMEEMTTHFPNCRFVDANPWLGPTCLSGDGLHLNQEGARRFGELLSRILTPKANE